MEELEDILDDVDPGGEGVVSFATFCALMEERINRSGDSHEDLGECFRALDRDGTGFITVDALQAMCHAYGEPLTSDEWTELLELARPDHLGRVDYEGYMRVILAPA